MATETHEDKEARIRKDCKHTCQAACRHLSDALTSLYMEYEAQIAWPHEPRVETVTAWFKDMDDLLEIMKVSWYG